MNTSFNHLLRSNPLSTRSEIELSLTALLDPVYDLMKAQGTPGRFHISDSGSVYDQPRQDIEGFLRTLWGVGPLCSTYDKALQFEKYFDIANEGILAGTNSQSSFYWGKLTDCDQLFVEMGALAAYLILTKENFWDQLYEGEQDNIYLWLDQINQRTIPKTNWLFFRILVNTFFELAGVPFSSQQVEADLSAIDSFYLEDGWYFDGYKDQIDYYIPFGMQYYGLLFAKFTPKQNHPMAEKFRERGALFAQTFKNWFVKNGTALPFGRSLTYRFAQSSYFSASAFAGISYKNFTSEEGKYLLLNNMRNWFRQPIFTAEGFLSIGYCYPNLVMAEGYNAPGSPYWALKNYMILALPEEDPFWSLPEKAPAFEEKEKNPASRMLLIHDPEGKELQAFTAGQHSHEHAHGEAKYEKFVYSATFGFSISKNTVLPKQGAFDNTLAVSDGDTHFRTAFGYEAYAIHDDYIYGQWRPWKDVTIKSFIIPCYPWHIRVHQIRSRRSLHLLSGSFSAPADGGLTSSGTDHIFYQSSAGTTGIRVLKEASECELMMPEPNTNLLYERTALPVAHTPVGPGQHLLITACLGNAGNADFEPEISARLQKTVLNYEANGEAGQVILEEI